MNKKLLAVAISGALSVPLAAQAIDFSVSGHVNRMIRYADDGVGSDLQQLDNTASGSRVRFQGSQDVGGGLTTGAHLEMGFGSSNGGSTPLKAGDVGNDFSLRQSYIWFSSDWGKLTMGHTSDASDGTTTGGDQDGAWAANEMSSPGELASPIVWRTANGGKVNGFTASGGALTDRMVPNDGGTMKRADDVGVGGAFSSFDGGRRDVLRYDTPSLGPVSFATSIGNDSHWAVGAFSNTDLGDGNLKVNVGYSKDASGNAKYGVGAGFLFSQGTNINFNYGQNDLEAANATDASALYVKLGHNWGNNSASISWGSASDVAAKGVDATQWGIGFNHAIPNTGVQFYTGYHNFELDASGVENVSVFIVGSRVRFN